MTATPATTPGFGRFFLPGPTEVLPEILAAQTRPMIGHRGKGMEQLIAQMMPGLQRIFRTTRPVYISSSSATGLMEAAVRNCGGRRVLALVNGAFSERFAKIAPEAVRKLLTGEVTGDASSKTVSRCRNGVSLFEEAATGVRGWNRRNPVRHSTLRRLVFEDSRRGAGSCCNRTRWEGLFVLRGCVAARL